MKMQVGKCGCCGPNCQTNYRPTSGEYFLRRPTDLLTITDMWQGEDFVVELDAPPGDWDEPYTHDPNLYLGPWPSTNAAQDNWYQVNNSYFGDPVVIVPDRVEEDLNFPILFEDFEHALDGAGAPDGAAGDLPFFNDRETDLWPTCAVAGPVVETNVTEEIIVGETTDENIPAYIDIVHPKVRLSIDRQTSCITDAKTEIERSNGVKYMVYYNSNIGPDPIAIGDVPLSEFVIDPNSQWRFPAFGASSGLRYSSWKNDESTSTQNNQIQLGIRTFTEMHAESGFGFSNGRTGIVADITARVSVGDRMWSCRMNRSEWISMVASELIPEAWVRRPWLAQFLPQFPNYTLGDFVFAHYVTKADHDSDPTFYDNRYLGIPANPLVVPVVPTQPTLPFQLLGSVTVRYTFSDVISAPSSIRTIPFGQTFPQAHSDYTVDVEIEREYINDGDADATEDGIEWDDDDAEHPLPIPMTGETITAKVTETAYQYVQQGLLTLTETVVTEHDIREDVTIEPADVEAERYRPEDEEPEDEEEEEEA